MDKSFSLLLTELILKLIEAQKVRREKMQFTMSGLLGEMSLVHNLTSECKVLVPDRCDDIIGKYLAKTLTFDSRRWGLGEWWLRKLVLLHQSKRSHNGPISILWTPFSQYCSKLWIPFLHPEQRKAPVRLWPATDIFLWDPDSSEYKDWAYRRHLWLPQIFKCQSLLSELGHVVQIKFGTGVYDKKPSLQMPFVICYLAI